MIKAFSDLEIVLVIDSKSSRYKASEPKVISNILEVKAIQNRPLNIRKVRQFYFCNCNCLVKMTFFSIVRVVFRERLASELTLVRIDRLRRGPKGGGYLCGPRTR